MKTLPNEPMALLCTYSYWGGKAQPWTFDIVVDDTKIAAQTLDQERADRFFDVKYAIPPELTRGKSSVVVKFAATPGQAATGAFLGGVFDCVMLKAKPTGE